MLRHCQCLAARPNGVNNDVPFSHVSEGRVEGEEGTGRGTADGQCSLAGAAGPRGAEAEYIHFVQEIPRAVALQAQGGGCGQVGSRHSAVAAK